ncbi:Protein CyaY [invertebrate metagenome]|uniref:Protein CyaY n=1 Tax=invertebrate metagenome TaxID=1711999 RepID=A0A2H9TA62_9ZZZZ
MNEEPMNESDYHQKIDELMLAIENSVDDSGLDIDYETSSGVQTLTLDNGSKVILSRQTPLRQLWVAAKSGGFHFDFNSEQQQWLCNPTGEPLKSLIERCLTEQGGESLALDAL